MIGSRIDADALATLRTRFASSWGDAAIRPGTPLRDMAAHAIGTPALVARPPDLAALAELVAAAAAAGIGVVPVGVRSAYWRPLHVEGVVALDLSALDHVRFEGDVAIVGAGALVRPLDEALRARGAYLPIHPDAFGDTSLGAMVATACASGIGMGQGPLSTHLAGLTVVTGTGELLHTGAAGAWPHLPPFVRDGVPDLTGLFLGSEGALGVVVQIALHLRPAPYRVLLSARAPDDAVGAVVEVGRSLARDGLIETFRAVRETEDGRSRGWSIDASIRSPLSADEAAGRASVAVERFRAALGVAPTRAPEDADARAGRGAGYDARWNGPLDGHRRFAERAQLVGLDVVAPYDALPGLLALADEVRDEQVAARVFQSRTALYLAPTFANLGMHAAAALDPVAIGWAHAHVARWAARFAEERVVPYRVGRTWPVVDAIRPEVRATWAAIKRHLDPAGILHPGWPLIGDGT